MADVKSDTASAPATTPAIGDPLPVIQDYIGRTTPRPSMIWAQQKDAELAPAQGA